MLRNRLLLVMLLGILTAGDPAPAAQWTPTFVPDYLGFKPTFKAIWASSANDIYALGIFGPSDDTVIYHYNGQSWSVVYVNRSDVDLVDLWGSGPGDVYAAGYQF